MPKSDAAKKSDKKYEQKRALKNVSFNLETDADLYEFAQSLDDFSGSVKAFLKKEMNKNNILKNKAEK